MAGKPVTKEPTSPILPLLPIMDPEDASLLKTLKEMGLKPKADTPEDLKQWMKEFLQSQEETEEKSPKDVKPKPALQLQQTNKDKPAGVTTHPPKVTCFSGAGHKGETTYDLWRYEVRCLMKDPSYTQGMKDSAIRRSLRGEAGRVAMHLGIEASINQILEKLDSIYGIVDNKEELMAEFYSARQKEDEDITS